MRKPAFCICENKEADQLFALQIVQSLYFINPKSLAIFCGCTSRFVLYLVGNQKDRFCRDMAHMNDAEFAI